MAAVVTAVIADKFLCCYTLQLICLKSNENRIRIQFATMEFMIIKSTFFIRVKQIQIGSILNCPFIEIARCDNFTENWKVDRFQNGSFKNHRAIQYNPNDSSLEIQ